jgi:hypothetical protein
MPISSAFSPVPSSQGKGNTNNSTNVASVISKEYLEAVSVLNEDTMNRACHLLLKAYDSDADTNAESSASTNQSKKKGKEPATHGDGENEKPVKDQLLEMYYKCQESLTVIRKQQSLPPVGPPGSAIPGSNTKKGTNHKKLLSGVPSLNGMKKRTVMTTKHGIHPSHKTTASAIGLGVGALKQKGMMPMAMKRMASINKIGGTVSSANATAKNTTTAAALGKAMLLSGRGRSTSPPQGEDSASSAAPPPSALSFLAKLNRDPNETAPSDVGDANGAGVKKEETKEVREEKESTERSKKNKKKKKSKIKQKTSDDDGNVEEKDKNKEIDDSDNKEGDKKKVEDRESHKKKRRRTSKNDIDLGDGNDKINDSPNKRKKVPRRGERASKKRPVIEDGDEDGNRKGRPNEEEEESSPHSSDDVDIDIDNDDGDTSADETYHGRSETSQSKRKAFSRKAKPDAETLVGGASPPSKRRKTRNNSDQKAADGNEEPKNSEDDDGSPSRRRNPRRGALRS